MRRITTLSGSIYEADEDKKLIRRVSGKTPATTRMGADGEWKPYLELGYNFCDGLSIVWRIDDTPEGAVARTTQTSRIVSEELVADSSDTSG